MGLIKKDLDKLYKQYGYEVLNNSGEVAIYLYNKGRYYGADIVLLNSADDTLEIASNIKETYSKSGYAANVKTFTTVAEAEEELYRSFFAYRATLERISKRYYDFVYKQQLSLGSKYKYISSPFESDIGDKDAFILSSIIDIVKENGAFLLIIEAAAGYGKTCTAFEILYHLAGGDCCKNAIFTELARNRTANIFRYVLLDEIDKEYPSLNSEIVKHEIQTGRLPLIIDGFDELLDSSIEKPESHQSFEEVESMLDTIGQLLENNAKIIITTRKTTIFTGEEFQQWYQKWGQQFKVVRFTIKEPRIQDWLGHDKLTQINQHSFPIQYVANPVLLTYLRSISQEDFIELLKDPESLVKKYFGSLLDREKERQNLIMTAENQYAIFKNVAQLLIELDVAAEKKEFFKEIIVEQNKKVLEGTLSLYSAQERRTLDNLADTLANHALLDRKGNNGDSIGFINDFVFGTFIGEIICETDPEKINKEFSSYMIELAATAYRVQNKTNKSVLWSKIQEVENKFDNKTHFIFDISLRESIMRSYSECILESLSVSNIAFVGFTFKSCVFINVYFKNCSFDQASFEEVSFIECTFESCTMREGGYFDEKQSLFFVKCKQLYSNVLQASSEVFNDDKNRVEIDIPDIEDMILELLWEITHQYKSQTLLKLMNGLDRATQRLVSRSLEKLERERVIVIRGSNVYFELNKISYIKSRIGK